MIFKKKVQSLMKLCFRPFFNGHVWPYFIFGDMGAACPQTPVSRLAHARGRILFVAVSGGILAAPRAPYGVFFIVLLWPLATLAG